MKPSLDYRCAKCGKQVTNWTAKIRDDGKLSLVGHCHGESTEFIIWLGMGGVLFEKPRL